jgi:predicted membrane metal-binding protein
VEGVVDNRKLDNPKLISDVESQSFGSGIRKKIVDFYQQVLPQTMSGLIARVTLGNRGAIMSDFWQKIKSAGVVYMASASGVIIALFISFLIVGATYFLPRRKAIPFVIFGQFNI